MAKKIAAPKAVASKFQIGSCVTWSARRHGEKSFSCSGKVAEIKNSVFGGKKKGQGLLITVTTKKYKQLYGKSWAFVSAKNVTLEQ